MKLVKDDVRVKKLRTLYQEHEKTSLILTRAPNLGWLLGGRVQIGIAGESCVCTAVINDEDVIVITNNIEGDRLAAEEFGSIPVIRAAQWDDPETAKSLIAAAAGCNPMRDSDVEALLLPIRTVLLPQQQDEARDLCRKTASAVTRAAFQVRPGMTEFEISGIVAQEVYSAGLIPNVLFTPADKHIQKWRHSLSTDNRLKKIVMLSLGAQRNGMYCSITRFVCFGNPDKLTQQAWMISAKVASEIYSQTVPGTPYDQLFFKIQRAYDHADAGEQIALHHQGGLGGFQTRELRIDAKTHGAVLEGQLYAWNPSAPGYKVEDMLLVGKSDNEILTFTPEFPYSSFEYGGKTWFIPQPLIF